MPQEYQNEGEDLYSDPSTPEPSPESTEEAEAPEEEGKEDSGQPSAVLPKAILAGKDFKPGDEVVLKITAIHENEIVVEYAPAKADEGEESGGGQAKASAPADSEMSGMMY